MLLRYPGKGNSIPSLRTVATSVPLPPVGPPPAFGASVFCCLTLVSPAALTFCAVVLPSVGVAGFAAPLLAPVTAGAVAAAVVLRLGTGVSRSVDWVAVGCVTDVVGAARPDVSSPMARSPGSAATMLIRYIGGSATGFCSLRVLNRSVATAACKIADSVKGPTSRDPFTG